MTWEKVRFLDVAAQESIYIHLTIANWQFAAFKLVTYSGDSVQGTRKFFLSLANRTTPESIPKLLDEDGW